MTGNHKQHVDRFNHTNNDPTSKYNTSTYNQAKMKCIVTIGQDDSVVRGLVEKTAADHGVDIIGLVVSQAHDSYAMYIKSAIGGGDVQGPVYFACDHVAKSLKTTVHGELQVVSAQELKHMDNLSS
jgi:hypothetical protein